MQIVIICAVQFKNRSQLFLDRFKWRPPSRICFPAAVHQCISARTKYSQSMLDLYLKLKRNFVTSLKIKINSVHLRDVVCKNRTYGRALGTTYFFKLMKFCMKICLSEIRLSTFTVFSKKIFSPWFRVKYTKFNFRVKTLPRECKLKTLFY